MIFQYCFKKCIAEIKLKTYIHFSAFKIIDSSVVKRVGRYNVMWSVTAVAVSAYRGPGLDVCPPVQEDLDGPEVAFLSSTVEGSISILSDI
jgi:hypothetical protein